MNHETYNLHILGFGAAAVFDTVFLLALLERRNWPFVRLPIVLMMAGAWLWHTGQFVLLLLVDVPESWYSQGMCMLFMTMGALLMPCSMLHAAWRVWDNKVDVQTHSETRHILVYLPMVAIVPLAFRFLAPDRVDFATAVADLEVPYVIFDGLVGLIAAAVFLGVGRRVPLPQGPRFFVALAAVLLAMTVLRTFVYAFPGTSLAGWEYWRLAVGLSPLAPALLFAYFVIRFQFFHIIIERSLVYGAILGSVIFIHQLAFQDFSAALPQNYRLHVIFLETLVLTGLVLSYGPLRQRTAEGLRYFLGGRVSPTRERLRHLSHELSAQAGRPVHEMLDWFVRSLREALQVEYVVGQLFHEASETDFRCGEAPQWSTPRLRWLHERMRSAQALVCSRRQSSWEIVRCLQEASASLAVVKDRASLVGLLVVGRTMRSRDLSEEETNGVVLLIEHLAITLDNSLLQAERLAAEHKAMQHEKLSTLGLLASSIAHEVKNPLSAIKTIATVMAEELGPGNPLAEDTRLILEEVDRLAKTTAQWLDLARPRNVPRSPASLTDVLGGTLRLLRHLAHQQSIALETDWPDDLPLLPADEHALREIFFNLLSNSLQAAGPGGKVRIHCRLDNGCLLTEICDSGTGMTEEVRRHLFEPFLTTKPAGTGLGLYLVSRRVSELGGVIHCDSSSAGTSFRIRLPYTLPAKEAGRAMA